MIPACINCDEYPDVCPGTIDADANIAGCFIGPADSAIDDREPDRGLLSPVVFESGRVREPPARGERDRDGASIRFAEVENAAGPAARSPSYLAGPAAASIIRNKIAAALAGTADPCGAVRT